MSDIHQEDKPPVFTVMSGRQVVKVALLGAAVGLLGWGLSFLLETYVLSAIVCQGQQVAKCMATSQYAEAAAIILAAGVGLFGLIRLQVFRPLLIVIAVSVSLWGLVGTVGIMTWYGAALACILLYAAAYILFSWIARIRLFWLVVLLLVIMVVLVRLTLTS